MISWKELAIEYRKEIQELWNCIEDAYCEFNKKVPKSYEMGLNILDKGVDLSMDSIRLLSCSEPIDVICQKNNTVNSKKEIEEDTDDWLFKET